MRVAAYYNEIDPYAAQWLRNLIAAGHIADGEVDERSISDVRPEDLRGFTQCHFFAGVGVWSYALRLARWPDTRPVWTGSCPCQSFSVAGANAGMRDERHLWPHWHWLIEEHRPRVVFGEQVEAAIRHGWLDLVQADMEGIDYAFAPVVFPAAGIGAPHIRGRLYFVADTDFSDGREGPRIIGGKRSAQSSEACGMADAEGIGGGARLRDRESSGDGLAVVGDDRAVRGRGRFELEGPGPTNGFWRDADWLRCRDGKWRPVEPGTFPLAHGARSRMGRLRAHGNQIVAQAAAEVIVAYKCEVCG